MFSKEIPNEYKTRITKVINFVLLNLSDDLSMEKLAVVAEYSPFHFQKIFKQVVGETPKQYVIRIRLETAAHALIIHRHKTVTEIALANGFSSSATFARAFKKYFGVSSEEFRAIPFNENAERYQDERLKAKANFKETEANAKLLNVTVKRISAFQGIFVNGKLNNDESIQTAFRKLFLLIGDKAAEMTIQFI